MNSRIIAAVQARIGSRRFPGKVMACRGPHKILEWVLLATLSAATIDQVVLVTSSASENDALCKLADRLSVAVLRGSEDDVLSRFALAAEKFRTDHVVRICAHNPFVRPVEIDRLVRFYMASLPYYPFNRI